MKTLHAVIPAGGAGTRLWPLSRRDKPKFLLDLLGAGHTLLQATALRLAPIAKSITVVTGRAHVPHVERQLEELQTQGLVAQDVPIQVVAEPSGRDSMPAIGIATYLLRKQHGDDAVVGSFAADHEIRRPEEFYSAVDSAIAAAQENYISTIGLEPTEPSTGFGYIQRSDDQVAPGAWRVTKFVEKPDHATAAAYLESGYLWNAGMFVMRAGALTALVEKLHPAMAAVLEQISNSWDRPTFQDTELDSFWEELPKIAIDHAVAEPAAKLGSVVVAPMSNRSGWSDLGDFVAVEENTKEEDPAPTSLLLESEGSVVRTVAGKKVVVLGIPGAIVIDTDDALLITTKARAQDVKDVPQALGDEGRTDLL